LSPFSVVFKIVKKNNPTSPNNNNSENNTSRTTFHISGNVYRITIKYGLRPNIGVSAGTDGILLVDTGHHETAEILEMLVRSFRKGDIHYIINTHNHGDHTGANEECGENATLIGLGNLTGMVSSGVLTLNPEKLTGRTGKSFGPYYYSMPFNGEEIIIIPYSGIHSSTDVLVYFSASTVVNMGDLLLSQSFPAISDVQGYLDLLDKIIDIFPHETIFISGYGRDSTIEDVQNYKEMLLTTIKIIRTEKEAGKNIADMRRENVLIDFESWGVFLEFLDANFWIEAVFNSY